jgi:hypothetical protein
VDLIIFLTLTRLVVVISFVNFSFALFTPPLGDFHDVFVILKSVIKVDRDKLISLWPLLFIACDQH